MIPIVKVLIGWLQPRVGGFRRFSKNFGYPRRGIGKTKLNNPPFSCLNYVHYCWLRPSLLNPTFSAMASKGAVLPLLRRELRSCRFARTNPSASILAPVRSRTPLSNPGRHFARQASLLPRVSARAFSQSLCRRLTDENGDFDPRSLDRESDEVDVCIVGGGRSPREFTSGFVAN